MGAYEVNEGCYVQRVKSGARIIGGKRRNYSEPEHIQTGERFTTQGQTNGDGMIQIGWRRESYMAGEKDVLTKCTRL
jgi:hypothetical protein